MGLTTNKLIRKRNLEEPPVRIKNEQRKDKEDTGKNLANERRCLIEFRYKRTKNSRADKRILE